MIIHVKNLTWYDLETEYNNGESNFLLKISYFWFEWTDSAANKISKHRFDNKLKFKKIVDITELKNETPQYQFPSGPFIHINPKSTPFEK